MFSRRISNIFIACIMLIAFGSVLQATADIEANKAIERRVFEEIWNQGALGVADEIYAPNFVFHEPTIGDISGAEGYKQMVAMYLAAFPDVHYTVEVQIAEGNMVATRWTATGTQQGEFMGIPPTLKQVTVAGMSIVRIVDGRIEETWSNTDQLGLLQYRGH